MCPHCGLTASAPAPGGAPRTHCPGCLHARHAPGRAESVPSGCRSRMAPISVAVLGDGAWRLIHRCIHCQELTSSPVRDDDNRLVLMHMAIRPLAQPPFPLEAFGDL
ncbi:MAG TPA: RNHCP domain-containing protein [Streptomyces sp.]|nr:RNHCP domain-containing protein [Streptomyces sp.]